MIPAPLATVPVSTGWWPSALPGIERHGLGEYYTPDWLAAKMVRQAAAILILGFSLLSGARLMLLGARSMARGKGIRPGAPGVGDC